MFPKRISKDRDNIFSGEREIGTKLEEVCKDHINRYHFAKYFIKRGDNILDAACGVGYGSYVMAERAFKVDGVDYSEEAVRYAAQHWSKDNIGYIRGDLLDEKVYPCGRTYEKIVSFETIEHLRDDHKFLEIISKTLAADGLLFISAPNADILKVEDNPWHERHYKPDEFYALLSMYFSYISEFTQVDCGVKKGRGGDNNILICSNMPFFKIKVIIFLVHTFLYRLKMKLLKSLEK